MNRKRYKSCGNLTKIFYFITLSRNLFWVTGWSIIDRNILIMINDSSACLHYSFNDMNCVCLQLFVCYELNLNVASLKNRYFAVCKTSSLPWTFRLSKVETTYTWFKTIIWYNYIPDLRLSYDIIINQYY